MTTLYDFKAVLSSIAAEVQVFLSRMDDNKAFDDIELDAVALTAIVCDKGRRGNIHKS